MLGPLDRATSGRRCGLHSLPSSQGQRPADLPVSVLELLSAGLVMPSDMGGTAVAVESSGHSRGNPRLFELIEDSPKTGASPTVWAWPQLIDHLKVAGQPVQGPWPPHQERRPDPDAESLPVAIPDPQSANDNS